MAGLDGLRAAMAELRARWNDPIWRRKRLAHRVVAPVHSLYPGRGGLDVMAADWDNLVVLDACRADLFEARAEVETFDHYRRVTSRASMTREWLERNFAGRTFGDTVYVSANPYTSRIAGDAFHRIVDVWAEAFDEETKTVPPEPVVQAARDAAETHPDKRLIVHFMQPHYPFLDHPDLTFDSWDPDRMRADVGHDGTGPHNVWQALELGLLDRERVWAAYGDNLQRVLGPARTLAATLGNRTVFTSDHGNMLGEWAWPIPIRLWGHPTGVRSPILVDVPWAVLDGPRRDTTDEGITVAEPGADVEERLRDLGYA